ncbi:MAG: histidine phosphatase family protein [Planctomycetota bacterium]
MTAARRLWLVRHGETEGQSSIRYHGSNDVALADVGRAQIRALAPLLAGMSPAVVVHSPLQRAAESARLLAAALAWPLAQLRADARLREISFGDCEGMTADEIAAAFPAFWAERQRGAVDAFPGGESRLAFDARVASAVAELAAPPDGGDVVVVAHRGTVRQALRHVLGLAAGAPDPHRAFAVRLGSLSVLCRQPAWAIELLDFVP